MYFCNVNDKTKEIINKKISKMEKLMNEWATAQIAARMSEIQEIVDNFINGDDDSMIIWFDYILEDFSFDVENDAPEFNFKARILLNAYEHAYAKACVELAEANGIECFGWSASGVRFKK